MIRRCSSIARCASRTLPALSDGLGLRSYLQIQVMQGDLPFGLRHYWKSHFVDSLTDDLIDEIVDHYLAHPQDGGTRC